MSATATAGLHPFASLRRLGERPGARLTVAVIVIWRAGSAVSDGMLNGIATRSRTSVALPPLAVVYGVGLGVALALALVTWWAAGGRPGLIPAARLLLACGIGLAAATMATLGVLGAYDNPAVADPLDPTQPYAVQIWQNFTSSSVLGTTGGGGYASVIALGALIVAVGWVGWLIVAVTRGPRLSGDPAAGLRRAKILSLTAPAGLLVSGLSNAWLPAVVGCLVLLIGAVVEQWRARARDDTEQAHPATAVGTATFLLLGVCSLWLPLLFVINALWPMRVIILAPTSGGSGK